MTQDASVHGNQHATKRWRITLIPLLASIALHGLLAMVALNVPLPLPPPSGPPSPDSPDSVTIRLVTPATPAPEATATTADAPAVFPGSSAPPSDESIPSPPDTGRRGATGPADAIVLQPLRTPTTSPERDGVPDAVTGPDVLAIRESIQELARTESERRALQHCTERQRRSELFLCEPEASISEEIIRGALLPDSFMATPAAVRVTDDQALPFTERDPSDRVLDNLQSGDRTYEMMKRVMGRR